MREIERTIVAAVLFSKDKKILMGRKDPAKGGVYVDCWHIPGGGVDENETKEQALVREVLEETGLDISNMDRAPLSPVGEGFAEKTSQDTGEKVLCHMHFHRFEIHLAQHASEIELAGNGEFVEMRWFSREELQSTKQIPGGREFFIEMGYLD